MPRLIAGVTGCFGCGVIIAEVLKGFGLFESRWSILIVAVPMALAFLFWELTTNYFEDKRKTSLNAEIKYQRIISIYHLALCVIAFCLLLSIPFLWWGAIKRLAMSANEGKNFF